MKFTEFQPEFQFEICPTSGQYANHRPKERLKVNKAKFVFSNYDQIIHQLLPLHHLPYDTHCQMLLNKSVIFGMLKEF